MRLLTVRTTRPAETEGALPLDTYEVLRQADVLTNIGGIHALTAWRLYNKGAVVEQRIEKLAQLSAGKTAVDDTGGNALLWSLAVVAYETLHSLREHFLSGSWRTAQSKRLRLWLFRLPAKLTTHARKHYLQFLRGEPVRPRLLAALRGLNHAMPATCARLSLRAMPDPAGRNRDPGTRCLPNPFPRPYSAFIRHVAAPNQPPKPDTCSSRPPLHPVWHEISRQDPPERPQRRIRCGTRPPGSIRSGGWQRMRIPFSQLRFGEHEGQVSGINFRRDIFHLGEGVTWSWRPPTEPGWTSQFGHLLGLDDIRRPARLEIMPYGVTHAAYDQRADPASPFDDGSVTGGLTLDATFNPDFGQVEADPAVVNLSAFETRFEERRPFFVEGYGLFGFGGIEGLNFFYSRRVGQRPALSAYGKGTYVDQPGASTILGAAKITGRTESDLVIAFMNATTQREMARFTDRADMPVGETPVDPLSNTTALRIRKDMREGSSFIGAIATGVVRDLDDEVFDGLRDRAFAGGVDFLHRFKGRTYSVQSPR